MNIIPQSVEFIVATPNIAEVIEQGCRTCYRSENLIKEGSAERIFNTIVKQNHHDSVTEHGSITVRITTDRAMLAQLTRHRIGFSYSVESQRYCNYSKDKFDNEVTFIEPMGLNEEAFEVWQSAMIQSEIHYFQLLKTGVKPEVARSVLPNSCKTTITMTGNVRAWRSLFKLRASGHAQEDIQLLSGLIHKAMIDNGIPKYFFDDIEFKY